MSVKKVLLHSYFHDLFENEEEMIFVIDSIIKKIELEEISSKIFLTKIKLQISDENDDITLDTGLFSDTLIIKAPKSKDHNLLSSFLPALQNSKINTILLLFSTLKPKYRKEFLLKS